MSADAPNLFLLSSQAFTACAFVLKYFFCVMIFDFVGGG